MAEMITSGQRKKLRKFCNDALDSMKIYKNDAQHVIKRNSELQQRIRDVILELSGPNGYPERFRIRTVREQLEILLQYFPKLDGRHVVKLANGNLPKNAEGWAVIPKPDKVASNYHEALDLALKQIVGIRQFETALEGLFTQKHLRLKEESLQGHLKLNKKPGDFWVFPFQFGAGHSVRKGGWSLSDGEFGLGPYEATILLLTHPDRITRSDQLNIECYGCEYSPLGNGDTAADFFACLQFTVYDSEYPMLLSYQRVFPGIDIDWGAISGFVQ